MGCQLWLKCRYVRYSRYITGPITGAVMSVKLPGVRATTFTMVLEKKKKKKERKKPISCVFTLILGKLRKVFLVIFGSLEAIFGDIRKPSAHLKITKIEKSHTFGNLCKPLSKLQITNTHIHLCCMRVCITE